MKNKKLMMYIGIVILILIVLGIGYLVYVNINTETNEEEEIIEYIPQEEITDEQLRQTVITLYFMDMNTKNIMPEARQIDGKELLENPYYTLTQLLVEGPKNESLVKLIPDGTILNSAELRGSIVYLDFSEEFIKEQQLGEEQEKLIVNSIVNTLTELTEVNSMIITIDGQENLEFPDSGVNFKNSFTRIN